MLATGTVWAGLCLIHHYHLGRKTRSAFFTPILASSALFARYLRVFNVILRTFHLPTARVFYSDPPQRFLESMIKIVLNHALVVSKISRANW